MYLFIMTCEPTNWIRDALKRLSVLPFVSGVIQRQNKSPVIGPSFWIAITILSVIRSGRFDTRERPLLPSKFGFERLLLL